MASGEVIAFDADKGWGTVRGDDDDAERFFHCASIADGSRAIAVGTVVSFDVAPGTGGRWEAVKLRTDGA